MVNLTGKQDVKAICPRCAGNGYIRLHDGQETNCPQCNCEGWVMLPAYQCRENVEGGIEPRWMKTGETI